MLSMLYKKVKVNHPPPFFPTGYHNHPPSHITYTPTLQILPLPSLYSIPLLSSLLLIVKTLADGHPSPSTKFI